MDIPSLIARLTEYVALLDAFDQLPFGNPQRAEVERTLSMREQSITAILHAADIPGAGMRRLFEPHARDTATVVGRTLTLQAIGYLEVKEDLERELAPAAPTLTAGAFHPWVWEQARGIWETGRYAVAVSQAATGIVTHVQARVDRFDVQDADLMTQVFRAEPPTPGSPRLRWPGDDADRTVVSIRDGLRGYAQGCFKAIRNPATHRPDDDMPEQEALERLAALSLLARFIEGCDVLKAE